MCVCVDKLSVGVSSTAEVAPEEKLQNAHPSRTDHVVLGKHIVRAAWTRWHRRGDSCRTEDLRILSKQKGSRSGLWPEAYGFCAG